MERDHCGIVAGVTILCSPARLSDSVVRTVTVRRRLLHRCGHLPSACDGALRYDRRCHSTGAGATKDFVCFKSLLWPRQLSHRHVAVRRFALYPIDRMATNKNQHFVPRCYLRQFTIDAGNKAINLYNIEHDRFIERAPVKNQCSGDYFYGKEPLLEDMIQNFEQSYAVAVSEIIRPDYRLIDEHRTILTQFWLMQHLRTEAASRRSVEMNETMVSTVGLDGAEFKLQIRDAVQMAMQNFIEVIDIVSDLSICLVRNRSNVPFVTSDDPAILSNRWHLQNQARTARSFGLSNAGALIFLPISPRVLCLGFDRDIHSVQHRNGWVDLHKDSDADAFNQHQYLNCRANLFVKDPEDFGAIRSGFRAVSQYRPQARHKVHYAVLDRRIDGESTYVVVDKEKASPHEEALVHLQATHAKPAAWPRQIGWRVGAHYFSNGTGVGYTRRAFTAMSTDRPFQKLKAFR
ncbi:hypothetical protein I35_2446 [Burkholderia cenocepacia H111]|nr:hypothetical protein I35_2446 [Burkholderia cenocepacia H111]